MRVVVDSRASVERREEFWQSIPGAVLAWNWRTLMVQIRNGGDGGAREEVRLRAEQGGLDFEKARDLARRKAREICAESMLLSWNNAVTGECYPTIACGMSNRPAWVVYAEARGADLTIDINDGQYTFMFLKLSK